VTGVQCPICECGECFVKWAGDTSWASSSEEAFNCTTVVRHNPEVWECSDCGHVFTNPQSWPSDLGAEYEDLADPHYIEMLPAKRRTFARAASMVSGLVEPGATVLEVGSYAGVFLDEMRKRSFDVTGIEPSEWGVRHSVERGHSVMRGTAEHCIAALRPRTFDAVVSWDVLEHVADPAAMIGDLASVTRPGGIVVVSTLDRTNWFARLLGPRWPWVIPMHLHYFDQDTVKRLAGGANLQFLDTGAHVHYSTPVYVVSRLTGRSSEQWPKSVAQAASHPIFPVGFGDVRYYVFRKGIEASR
jgi:SAM-dependent methyltransferase